MGKHKHKIAIVGCGKAGFEHARVLRTYFRDRCLVVRVIDLDSRNEVLMIETLGNLYNPTREQQACGIVLDCRPHHVRVEYPINQIATTIFNEYHLIEEKPATQLRNAIANYKHPEVDRDVNVQRVHSPAWKAFSKGRHATNVICIERNPAFATIDATLIGDYLPHSCSFVFDLIDSKLTEVMVFESSNIVSLRFENKSIAKIIFESSDRPSCTVILQQKGATHAFHWPHGFCFKAVDKILPFFSILGSLSFLPINFGQVKRSLRQYYLGPALYDDFRFFWREVLSDEKSGFRGQLTNQQILSENCN